MKFCIRTALFYFLLITLSAYGDKPESNLQNKSTSPFQSSIEGVGAVRFWYSLPLTMPSFKRQKLMLPSLLRNKLKYDVYKNMNSSRWIVFVPGIFGHLSAPYVKFIVKSLYRLNYNIVVVPNSFTHRYLKSDPIFKPGNISLESLVVCAVIKNFKAQEKVTTPIELFGVSYGGLLSTAVASQCSENVARLTAISPPLDLSESILIIDQMINKMKTDPKKFRQVAESSDWLLFSLAKIGFHENYRDLFVKFFVKGLSYSIRNYHRYSSEIKKPQKSEVGNLTYNSTEYIDWEAKLDFTKFFFNDRKIGLAEIEKTLKIQHWLDILKTKKIPFSILSSRDDPINHSKGWDSIVSRNGDQVVSILSLGGHLGMTRTPRFQNFLNKRFL